MKNILKSAYALLFIFVLGGIVSNFTGLNPFVATGAVATLAYFGKPAMNNGYLYDSIDLSAISRYAHQFQRKLITTLMTGLDIASDIMVMPNVKSSMKLPKLTVGKGWRPFSSSTEFKTNNEVYSDRELKVDVGKREILIDPEEYRHTYLSLMLSAGSGANKMEIPFAQYLWDEVIKKVQNEINQETAYFGFDKTSAAQWLVGTAYTAGNKVFQTVNGVVEYFEAQGATTGDDPATDDGTNWLNVTARAVVPGIESVILAAITASEISPVVLGSVTTAAEALTAFRAIFRSMPVPYKNYGVIVHASYTDTEFLLDGIEDKLSKYTTPDVSTMMAAGLIPIPGTDGKGWAKPASWLGSSRRLIAEPMNDMLKKGENLVMGTDLLSDFNEITTNKNLWTLEAGIKGVLGFQISDTEAIRVGDQS